MKSSLTDASAVMITPSDAVESCSVCGCSHSHSHPDLHMHGTYDPTYEMPALLAPEDFVTSGARWTDGGGFTSVLGGSGGTVEWSLGGAGLNNVTGQNFYTGASVDMSSFLSFDFEATLQRAFDEWSTYGDINFVQVADGGGDIGAGADATIRIVGGFIDGQSGSNVLARAFYPSPNVAGGDIVFDNGNTSFYSNENNFFLTALHEIGHAIGLGHEQTSNAIAIMNPSINTSLSGLQPDDIAGVQAVYGAADSGSPDLIASNVSVSDTTLSSGDTFTVSYDITNAGDGTAADTTAGIYLSTDATITTADILLGSDVSTTSNAPGAVDSETVSITLPTVASGTYYIGVVADRSQDEPGESSEANNASASPVEVVVTGISDDFVADVSTTGVVSVDGSASGAIEFSGDRDWFAVTLSEGQEYTIDLEGSPTGQGSLSDPLFYGVHTAAGALISGTVNDDGGTGLNSQLTFTASTSGTHFLSAGAYSANQGTYALSVTRSAEITGTASSETLQGDERDNIMLGLGGTDFLNGFGGNDTLDVGAGDGSFQYARGHDGNDTYIYAKEQGRLFIDPRFEGAADGTADRVVFTDLNASDLSISFLDYGGAIGLAARLLWADGSGSGELRIGQEGQHIETFQFADGSTQTWAQLIGGPIVGTTGNDLLDGDVRDNVMSGLEGTDTLNGFEGDDTLDVGAGDGSFQYARGYTGNDVYIYAKEQGNLFVDPRFEGAGDGIADTVVFTDLNAADLSLAFFDYGGEIGNAVRLLWNDGGASGELRIGQEGQYIEAFQFADGTTQTWAELIGGPISGTPGNDVVNGDARDNVLLGLGGTDSLNGFAGNDTLDVGAGDGSFQYARGHEGNDTYIYAMDHGRVFIDPRFEGAADGTADRVVFTDLNAADLSYAFFDYGGDIGNAVRMIWSDASGSGELRIGQEARNIETFSFADGTNLTWDEMMIA